MESSQYIPTSSEILSLIQSHHPPPPPISIGNSLKKLTRFKTCLSKCGLAKTQEAYHQAVTKLFNSLDRIETHLHQSTQNDKGPYYFGSQITEADIRLYVTIVRFDPVYVSLFKTNRGMIRHDYPNINRWARNLYWNVPAFKDTTSFEHIKGHYFRSLTMLNPEGVVPEGPLPHILPLN